MRRSGYVGMLVLAGALGVAAQEKGVDVQTEKIREVGTSTGSGSTRSGTGSGSGVTWGGGRTVTRALLPNPFRFTGRIDVIVKAVQDSMTERKMIPDDSTSRPAEGLIISQPYAFSKGAVVSRGALSRYTELLDSNSGAWTGARYTFTVQVLPIDGSSANVMVSAKIEGRSNDILRTEWLSLTSNGVAEDEFISELVERLTGNKPGGIVVP